MQSNPVQDKTNQDRAILDGAFQKALGLPANGDLSQLAYGKTAKWDSVAHVGLVSAIEDAFGVVLDGDDIVSMMSYAATEEVLKTKYGIFIG
jgi:acyl carrier protein